MRLSRDYRPTTSTSSSVFCSNVEDCTGLGLIKSIMRAYIAEAMMGRYTWSSVSVEEICNDEEIQFKGLYGDLIDTFLSDVIKYISDIMDIAD